MTNTAPAMIVAAGISIALLIGLPTGNVAAGNPPACVPAAVPAEYLIYHALAAAHPALPLHASCPSNKVIRT
ncbi:MAG: hypothetical protein U0932_12305 [Thiobacillus sp.]|nr:hypothetical protein [Thiobacillus sp.]